MKVAVTSKGTTLNDQVDPRFGRCANFVVVETDDMSVESIVNDNASASGGAGIQSAQCIADKGAAIVLTGNCGPNAFRTLEAAGIKVATGATGTVQAAIDQYKAGAFATVEGPTVESHAGMKA
jgi:predicted Fe-Mo cluster-binding NifX family protein